MHALLTTDEMARADAAAIDRGICGETLMENAGRAVAEVIRRRFSPRPTLILCGPGNNGGDGFVIARHLAASGWPVTVATATDTQDYGGDAATMAARWQGPVIPLAESVEHTPTLIVDALFGAGLSKPIDGVFATAITHCNALPVPVVAVDVPSGVNGSTGVVDGPAVNAHLTVTFFRRKPGHLLLPGKEHCGDLHVVDIGIPASVLETLQPNTWANDPALWLSQLPLPGLGDHKYTRGNVLIAAGSITDTPVTTGATVLSALAARRMGAGLVTVTADRETIPVLAAHSPGMVFAPVAAEESEAFEATLSDRRRTACLIGPGAGLHGWTRARTLSALATGMSAVLDADALSIFKDDPATLFHAITGPCILSPHGGEFGRLFDTTGDKLTATRTTAATAGAVIIHKGSDTVIAAPDGRAVINDNAPPWLATAGSGDVLSGMCLALLGQGMDAFDAACAAVWLHGETAAQFGPGMIAEDVIDALPRTLEVLGEVPEV